jgi:hypothetical protein
LVTDTLFGDIGYGYISFEPRVKGRRQIGTKEQDSKAFLGADVTSPQRKKLFPCFSVVDGNSEALEALVLDLPFNRL